MFRYQILVRARGAHLALRLVAATEPLFGRAAELLELSKSSAQNSRDRLVATGQLTANDGTHTVVDPLYEDWLAHRFPV